MAQKDEKQASARLRRLHDEAERLRGIDAVMMDDLLAEYDALATMTEGLRKDVQKDGVMIKAERGAANNRHLETVENPAFTTYSKSIQRLGDLAKKLSGFAKGGDDGEEEEDELMVFNARR